jgi:deoxyribodipyrimidine photo-lyase
MDSITFPTDFKSIQSRLLKIDPIKYADTRNYLNGSVTHISPYLTHGVVSTKEVAHNILSRYNKQESFTFIFELAWREYWHKVWMNLKNIIEEDIQSEQTNVINRKMIKSVYNAQTGIIAIDEQIESLYKNGYVHNHARMWVASLVCNISKTHWKLPSKWLYYHLLDGDIASNTLSWQWVAGTFSNKKYYFNQDNVNKYSGIEQSGTFLDKSYDEIKLMSVPLQLQELVKDIDLTTKLPDTEITEINAEEPVLLYNIWNLKPNWHLHKKAQRILVLEPSHFNKYPISSKRMDFILELARNIPDLKIYVGEIFNLKNLNRCKDITSIQYTCTDHWPGKKEERDFLFKDITGHFKSFSSFWEEAQEIYKKL